MVVFELTMPNRGSWNGRWSGENDTHIIVKHNQSVPADIIGKDFWYTWDDGWSACISVTKLNSRSPEYRDLVKRNTGFCSYNWMVESIINFGEIRKPNRGREELF